ncbi:DUF6397 family protein [Streptomyces axinellae]|uniref:DUF6397 family protein n=2 Tax=Streptomyces axinellae TaxID=552788 RepID=A0ABP6CE45_9ACTN
MEFAQDCAGSTVGDTPNVGLRTAAKELGLRPRELALAVQTGELRTVPGAPGRPRRVAREELDRVRGTKGFPQRLHERLRVVGTGEGSALLGISPSRFVRLARAGCFGPVKLYVNRYRTIVWLYLAEELREFGERNPALLAGRLPEGLRAGLDSGADHRASRWRSRRVQQLTSQADSPWERAAAWASVLDDDTLARTVPDPAERARLAALRPPLVEGRSESEATRDALDEVCFAEEEDEIRWFRLTLHAALEEARSADPCTKSRVRPGPAADAPAPVVAGHALPESALGAGRPDPGTPHPVTGPSATGQRRRWSLRGRRAKPTVRPAR